jgi:hypothetical protein
MAFCEIQEANFWSTNSTFWLEYIRDSGYLTCKGEICRNVRDDHLGKSSESFYIDSEVLKCGVQMGVVFPIVHTLNAEGWYYLLF